MKNSTELFQKDVQPKTNKQKGPWLAKNSLGNMEFCNRVTSKNSPQQSTSQQQ